MIRLAEGYSQGDEVVLREEFWRSWTVEQQSSALGRKVGGLEKWDLTSEGCSGSPAILSAVALGSASLQPWKTLREKAGTALHRACA